MSTPNNNEINNAENTPQLSNKASASRPLWWAVSITLLSVLYLFPEIIFNYLLVFTAGGNTGTTDLKTVELFGRAVSGIGVSLLVADFVIKGKRAKSVSSVLVSLAVVFSIVWPATYFGQKLLVDSLLINNSTEEQRKRAYFANMLKSSVVHNAVKLDGIPYNPEQEHSAEDMTFMTLFAGLLYADKDLSKSIIDKQEKIISRYAENRARSEFKRHYAKYNELKDEVNKAYDDYEKELKNFKVELKENVSSSSAEESWNRLSSQTEKAYNKYKSTQITANKKMYRDTRFRKDVNNMSKAVKRMYECETKRCWNDEESIITDFNKQYSDVLLRDAKISDFLINGRAPVKYQEFTWDMIYYTMMALRYNEDFIKKTGQTYLINSLEAYKRNEKTVSTTKYRLKNRGIIVSDNWNLNDKSGFYKAYEKSIRTKANDRWKDKTQLKTNLSWEQFQRSDKIQDEIMSQMGERYYQKPMLATWNNKQFYKHVIKPIMEKEKQQARDFLNSPLEKFANGGELERDAKLALRSILVPPISMSLSLMLVILTALKIPVKIISLFSHNKEQSMAILKIRRRLLALTLILIIFAPFALITNSYTEKGTTVSYFLDKTEDAAGITTVLVLKWALRVQPFAMSTGKELEKEYDIYKQIDENIETLKSWDERVFKEQ